MPETAAALRYLWRQIRWYLATLCVHAILKLTQREPDLGVLNAISRLCAAMEREAQKSAAEYKSLRAVADKH